MGFPKRPSSYKSFAKVETVPYSYIHRNSKIVVFGSTFGHNNLGGTQEFYESIVRPWFVAQYRPQSIQKKRHRMTEELIESCMEKGYRFLVGEGGKGEKNHVDLFIATDGKVHMKLIVSTVRHKLRQWSTTFWEVDLLIAEINPSTKKRQTVAKALQKVGIRDGMDYCIKMKEDTEVQNSGFYKFQSEETTSKPADSNSQEWRNQIVREMLKLGKLCKNLRKENPNRLAHSSPIIAGRAKWLEINPFPKDHPQWTFIVFLILIWSPSTSDKNLLKFGPRIIASGLNCPAAFVSLSKQKDGISKIALAMSSLGRYGMNVDAILNLCYSLCDSRKGLLGLGFEDPIQVKQVQGLKWFGPKIVGIVLETAYGVVHCIPTDVHVHRLGMAFQLVHPAMTQPQAASELESIIPNFMWPDINPIAGQLGQLLSSPNGNLRSAIIYEYNQLKDRTLFGDEVMKRFLALYERKGTKSSEIHEESKAEGGSPEGSAEMSAKEKVMVSIEKSTLPILQAIRLRNSMATQRKKILAMLKQKSAGPIVPIEQTTTRKHTLMRQQTTTKKRKTSKT